MGKLHIHVCARCHNEWASRQERPRACGVCKSVYWDRPYKSMLTKNYGLRLRSKGVIIIRGGK